MLVQRFVCRIWFELGTDRPNQKLSAWLTYNPPQGFFRAKLVSNLLGTAMENKLKKFSTIALFLVLCSSPGWSVFAAEPVTKCAFLANAPDKHVVVKGDTLWGISQKFLNHPWCWPRVWGMNRQEIKNPHWIYPGQVVYFDRAAGRLRLGKPMGSGELPNVRLSPQIRSKNLIGNAIATIPANAIEPFLSQPLVLEQDELVGAPHVVAANRSHILGANSDKAYVVGDLGGHTDFQLYRPSVPLIDPATDELLGFEFAYVGSVKLQKLGADPDQAHTFLITNVKEEVTKGDLLLSVPEAEMTNYAPHPHANPVEGRVVSVYGGVALAGQNQTVSVSLGSNDGMDIGTVLTMYRTGKTVVDSTGDNQLVRLPDEEYGTLLVYRVFNNVSYGLIMDVSATTRIGDTVRSPE